MHVSGLWEEAGIPGGTQCMHRENMQVPYSWQVWTRNPCVNHCAIVENALFSLDILKPLNKTLILQWFSMFGPFQFKSNYNRPIMKTPFKLELFFFSKKKIKVLLKNVYICSKWHFPSFGSTMQDNFPSPATWKTASVENTSRRVTFLQPIYRCKWRTFSQ